jgi:putative FMN-binding domain protein
MNNKLKAIINAVVVAAVSAALLFGMSAVTDSLIQKQESEAAAEAFRGLLEFEKLEPISVGSAEGIAEAYRALDKNGNLLGYAVTSVVKGYGGDMTVHTALSADGGTFLGLRVGRHMETEGYGAKAAESAYTDRFKNAKAPVSLNGYTGIEGTESGGASSSPASSPSSQPAASLKDGVYRAEQAAYTDGYRYFLELTVKDGRISAVNWDAYKENSESTKKKESEAGRYVMTETGKKWHEQAKIMEDALVHAGDPAKITYHEDNGKTDAYAGVSVDVSAFVELANAAYAKAQKGDASSAARYKDGVYTAKETGFEEGYQYFIEITVKDGKISAVNWDAYKKNSESTKKKESEAGRYVMTETGKKWHEQAKIMEDALIKANDPGKIVYSEPDGKTDAYAGVSVDVSAFVELAVRALEDAQQVPAMAAAGTEIDGISGATVSSKAVVKAANLAYRFVQSIL